jgi:hypothetical protein
MDRWLAIISDLHIGEGILDDFDRELEEHLIGFLRFLANRPQPCELLINGDFPRSNGQYPRSRSMARRARCRNGSRLRKPRLRPLSVAGVHRERS